MDDFIKNVPCDTLPAFWDSISPVGKLFQSPSIVFRGQGLDSWELIPRVFRGDVLAEFKHGMFAMQEPDHPFETFFEFSLLHEFLYCCDVRGLTVPGDSPDFREYMTKGPMIVHSISNDKWPDNIIRPFMALAQHHGIPTRLLDVSSNPYVAAYFAAVSAIQAYFRETEGQPRADFARTKRLAVFGIDFGLLHKVAGIDEVRVPGSTSPNLSAQSGSFLLVANSGMRGEPFTANVSVEQKLASLPEISHELNTPIDATLLVKVTLPIAYASELLRWCRRHGFSAATIFPGYDGAALAAKEFILAERFAAGMKPSSHLA